ncbi:MAG: phosphatase PAP2 family protein [Nitrospira sp.]|nr:phosphatase PAP2 family protein [Nitrospira sp.]MDI3465286.1 putative membrane-associated phospholipid phosphatase, PAP2 superfamily [Nitrospira sp.]
MISSGSPATDSGLRSVLSQSPQNTTSSIAAVGCSCAALAVSFFGLAQFDLPITKYVRSVTVHLPWDQLTVPWMAFTSDTGDWIGQGWRLAAVSLLLLIGAWAFEKPTVKIAAIQSLIAHGIAALLANVMKHLVGRPRPKFVHAGDWHMSISWASGWDSFPSGHSTASFAVATVLARRFPLFGPLCIAVALFVALSRVLRGSHFPTDVLGGAVIGILSGFIATAPLKQWRTSIQDGLRHAAMGTSALFALLWVLSRRMEEGAVGILFLVLGVVAVAGGLWIRRIHWVRRGRTGRSRYSKISALLIAYGLAAMTTSPLVISSVGFACLASWLHMIGRNDDQEESPRWGVMRESALMGGLAIAILILVDARGVLSFQ